MSGLARWQREEYERVVEMGMAFDMPTGEVCSGEGRRLRAEERQRHLGCGLATTLGHMIWSHSCIISMIWLGSCINYMHWWGFHWGKGGAIGHPNGLTNFWEKQREERECHGLTPHFVFIAFKLESRQ